MIAESNRLNGIKEYYFSQKLQEIRELQASGQEIINLGIGNPDMMPSINTIEALNQSSYHTENLGYQSYRGIIELRKAISTWQKQIFNVQTIADTEILPLMGSKEGIIHISNAFLNQDDEVLVPDPGYPTYATAALLAGAQVRKYDLKERDNWQIDIDQLAQTDLSKVKLMWVNYPHMPTGTKGNMDMFKALVTLAQKNNFLLCNDNPYSLILNDSPQSILEIEGAKEVCVELNSLSKSHNMAGWRIGWVSGDSSYINTILKIKSNMDSGMFLPIQHAAISALSNSKDWYHEQNVEYEKRRELAWHLIDVIEGSYTKNSVGMFVWAKISDKILDVEDFVDDLIYKAGVFVAPGSAFGSNGSRFVRVSLCASIEKFTEAIVKVTEFMKNRES